MVAAHALVSLSLAAFCLAGCGSGPAETTLGEKPSPAGEAPAARTSSAKNACGLFDLEEIEAIAGQKLGMLHDIQGDDETVCELRAPGGSLVLVSVTAHWSGGKELAGINQAALGMAQKLLGDKDTDLQELTGSETIKGLADQAFYSDVMPSWVLKGDVLVEVISPTFGHDQTKGVFLAVAKKALSRL